MVTASRGSFAGVFGALLLPDSVKRDSIAISASLGDGSASAAPNCNDGEAMESETLDLDCTPLRCLGKV